MKRAKEDFLDVNVLVALSDPDHPFHDRALRYYDEEAGVLVLSWIQLMGMVRVLTNSRAVGGSPAGIQAAWNLCRRWKTMDGVLFARESEGLEDQLAHYVHAGFVTKKLWTDAFLAAWAVAEGYRLVTFDRDFLSFPGLDVHLLAP